MPQQQLCLMTFISFPKEHASLKFCHRATPQGAWGSFAGNVAAHYTPQVPGMQQYLWLWQDHHSPEPAPRHCHKPSYCHHSVGAQAGEQCNSLLSHPAVSSRAVKNEKSFQANSNNSKSKHSLREMLLKVSKKHFGQMFLSFPKTALKTWCVFSRIIQGRRES